jgi:hypothetical protein
MVTLETGKRARQTKKMSKQEKDIQNVGNFVVYFLIHNSPSPWYSEA